MTVIFHCIFHIAEKSTSTGNILAQKIERMRGEGNSAQELMDEALYEVSAEPFCYEGKMLKKFKNPSNCKLGRKRSKSMDATAHYSLK